MCYVCSSQDALSCVCFTERCRTTREAAEMVSIWRFVFLRLLWCMAGSSNLHTHTHTVRTPLMKISFELFKNLKERETSEIYTEELREALAGSWVLQKSMSRWRAIPSETEERKWETVIKQTSHHRADETSASQNEP